MTGVDRLRSALVRRLEARRWVIDVARSTPTARRARRSLERVRVERLVRVAGGPDAALQRIVDEALTEPSAGDGEPT